MGFAGNSKPPATLPGSWSSSPSRMGTPVKRQAVTAGSHQPEKLRIWVFPPRRNPARLLWHHLLSSHANVPFSVFCEDKGIKQTRSAIQRLAFFLIRPFDWSVMKKIHVTRLILSPGRFARLGLFDLARGYACHRPRGVFFVFCNTPRLY